MKILFATGIYPPDIGGPATYTRAMARALKERGHEVEVVCYADDKKSMGEEIFLVHRILRSEMLPIRYVKFAWKIFVRARKMKADIVYLQGPVSEGFPGTIGAILAGVPTTMKVVGDYAWEIYQGSLIRNGESGELLDEFILKGHSGKIRLLEFIERWTAKRAKRVITPSNYLKEKVMQWGIPSEKIKVIYNEIQSLPAGMSRDETRKVFDLDDKSVLFTAVRAVPWKNIDFLIKILAKLKNKNIILAIAGNGPCLDVWKKEAKKNNIENQVRFLDKLDRKAMGEWYRAADLFVLPSLYEGYPNVVPEAWSQGLPCFISNYGGNGEVHAYAGRGRGVSFPEPKSIAHIYELNEQKWIDELNAGLPKRFVTPEIDTQANFNAMVDEVELCLTS